MGDGLSTGDENGALYIALALLFMRQGSAIYHDGLRLHHAHRCPHHLLHLR